MWWTNWFDFSNQRNWLCLGSLSIIPLESRNTLVVAWAISHVLFFYYRFHQCDNCIFTSLARISTLQAWKIRNIGTPSPHHFSVILLMSLRRLNKMDQQPPALMKRYSQWNSGATGAGALIQTSQSWNPTSRSVNLPSLPIFCRKTGCCPLRCIWTALRC